MEAELISQGLELALIGMGTVFVFLVLLIGATTLMSALVQRLAPEPAPTAAGTTAPASAPGADEELVAVIGAAIRRHRLSKRER